MKYINLLFIYIRVINTNMRNYYYIIIFLSHNLIITFLKIVNNLYYNTNNFF